MQLTFTDLLFAKYDTFRFAMQVMQPIKLQASTQSLSLLQTCHAWLNSFNTVKYI